MLKAVRGVLINRFTDFWLLGGASMVLWGVLAVGTLFRDRIPVVDGHFLQLGALFSILSILFNHPHFMISYRFGYGRGPRFILKHWFSLIAVPVALIALYIVAYRCFDQQITDTPVVAAANQAFEFLHLGFRLGTLPNLGVELLSLSVWLMFLTVGWHYSKQVFGCMMVYARYDEYPLSRLQRGLIKASVFAVAFLNFFYLAIHSPDYGSGSIARSYFFNIPLVTLGLPDFLIPFTGALVGLLAAAVLYFVCYANYRDHGKRPSLNFLVAWVAFHAWWIPVARQPEFYFMVVPFAHALQYLPFAYRLEIRKVPRGRRYYANISLRVALLLAVGFCAFELVPSLLDAGFETNWNLKTWFFMIAFAVFINVHHFFIDGVVWKLDQPEVRLAILNPA